jgi:hypothetical protein
MGAYPGPKHLGYSVHSLREKSSNDYRWGFGGLQSLAAAAGRKTTSHSRRRRSGRPPGDRPAMALTASGLSPALPWGRNGRPLVVLRHRVISRRHTVGSKRVWMRGVSESIPHQSYTAAARLPLCQPKNGAGRNQRTTTQTALSKPTPLGRGQLTILLDFVFSDSDDGCKGLQPSSRLGTNVVNRQGDRRSHREGMNAG